MFLESAFPICRESIALAGGGGPELCLGVSFRREGSSLDIRSARRSTGCCSITSSGSCQNTRDVSRMSTGFTEYAVVDRIMEHLKLTFLSSGF
jgi:hypothetical protein